MKKLLLTLLISIGLIGISQALTFTNSSNNNSSKPTNAFDGEYRLTGSRSLSTTSWGYSVVSDIVRAGKDSQRFEVRPGDCGKDPDGWNDCERDRERSEISLHRTFLPGDNQWIGFSVYLPEDFQTSHSVSVTLGQIHQSGGNRPTGATGGFSSFPPVVQLEVIGGDYEACIHILEGSANNVEDRCNNFELSRISDMRGRWTDIEIHFDTTDKKSLIEIYVNKERKVLLEDFVNFWPQKFHVKYGIYRSFVSKHGGPMPTQIAWFDEIKMGNTREEIAINEAKPVYVYSEKKESSIKTSDAFDDRYSFNILRQGVQSTKIIGSGYIEINNGIMTVVKDGRTINVDSVDLYDSFKGRIDKKGNISARFTMYPMCGAFRLQELEFSGNINAQLKTKCGIINGFEINALLELKKE